MNLLQEEIKTQDKVATRALEKNMAQVQNVGLCKKKPMPTQKKDTFELNWRNQRPTSSRVKDLTIQVIKGSSDHGFDKDAEEMVGGEWKLSFSSLKINLEKLKLS